MHVFLRFWPGSPGSLDFSCQDTNSVSSFNFCACRKPSGCWLRIMRFSLEFQPSTALLVLCRYWCIFHISMGTFCFCIIAGHSNQEIRLISHSVVHCYDHKPTFFYFIDKQVCQSNTHSAYQSDFFSFFVFHCKTNILRLSPQALIKMKVTFNTNGVWKDFIYRTDDQCFRIVLYNCFWPKRTPVVQQS